MTEIGVYILGAMALALLGAAGIAEGNHAAAVAAIIAAGAAYLAQLGAVNVVSGAGSGARWFNGVSMVAALASWAFGVWSLL